MGPQNGQYGYYGPMQQSRPNTPSFQNFVNGQQPISQRPQLVCRFVESPDEIMPVDVPSNGDPAFFVKRDFTAIYAKAFNNRGTIDDVVYAPVKQEKPEDIQRAKDEEFKQMVMSKFNVLENLITSLLASPVSEQSSDDSNKKRGGK